MKTTKRLLMLAAMFALALGGMTMTGCGSCGSDCDDRVVYETR
jgi:hypothetical protein